MISEQLGLLACFAFLLNFPAAQTSKSSHGAGRRHPNIAKPPAAAAAGPEGHLGSFSRQLSKLIYQVCRTQVGLFAPRSSINSQLVNSRGTQVVRQQLQAADQKANNSLGVEPFVMSWQQASSGLTWGQGGVPLLGNLHILSPLFLFHTLLLGNTLLYWTGRHR